MIVKVPIYVEIIPVPTDDIKYIVERLNVNFTLDLLESKSDNVIWLGTPGLPKSQKIVKGILTQEQALDFLRRSK